MADARSLLKAKRLERGVAAVPARAAAGSLRAKEGERLRKGKRKLENSTGSVDVVPTVSQPLSDKRRRIENPEIEVESTSAENGGFPADFFSDPSRKLPTADDDDDEGDDDNDVPSNPEPASLLAQPQPQPKPFQPTTPASNTAQPNIDDEFVAFERAIQAASRPKRDTYLEAFSEATISAEAELVSEVPDGFPPSVLEQSGGDVVSPSGANAGDAVPEVGKTEIDRQRRKGEEERELIVDRLLEEERAQEDADAKVSALKARLEAIKLKRAARKAGS